MRHVTLLPPLLVLVYFQIFKRIFADIDGGNVSQRDRFEPIPIDNLCALLILSIILSQGGGSEGRRSDFHLWRGRTPVVFGDSPSGRSEGRADFCRPGACSWHFSFKYNV